jgi:hypothetical protein
VRLVDAIRLAGDAAALTGRTHIIYRDPSGAIGYAPDAPHGATHLLRITPQRVTIVPGRRRSD